MLNLPIEPEILRKRMAIPAMIAELSYTDQDEGIKYLRIWGEKKMPVTELFEQLTGALDKPKRC